MKMFVSEEDFRRVLALLGLPGETLSIEIGGRSRWVMTGVNSTWAMRAVIGNAGSYDAQQRPLEPYQERVVYVPVMISGDEARLRDAQLELGRRVAQMKYGRQVAQATTPAEDEAKL